MRSRLPLAAFMAVASFVVPPPAVAEAPTELAALFAEAESVNAALRAAAERSAGARHGPAQARSLDDPILMLSFQNESLDSFTLGENQMSNIALEYAQEMPWGGKRRLAEDVAVGELTVLTADEANLRVELRSAVKVDYVELLFIDRTLDVLDESRRLLTTLGEIVRARYESGGAMLENVLRIGAEVARLDLEIAELRGNRRKVEADLGGLLGRTGPAAFGPVSWIPVVAPWTPADLESGAIERSTIVARGRTRIALEQSRLEAAKRATKPDWSWRAGYAERGSLDPLIMGGVGLRLPLRSDNKQDEAIARSHREVAAARFDLEDDEARLLAELRALIAEVETADVRRNALEQAVIPLAHAAYEAAQAAYENGQADFATAFDNFERRLGDTRLLEVVRAAELGALARLEPLAGRELLLAEDGGSHE